MFLVCKLAAAAAAFVSVPSSSASSQHGRYQLSTTQALYTASALPVGIISHCHAMQLRHGDGVAVIRTNAKPETPESAQVRREYMGLRAVDIVVDGRKRYSCNIPLRR